MLLECLRFRSLAKTRSTRPVVGVLSRDESLLDSLALACQAENLKCRCFKNPSRLLKKSAGDAFAAVLWDTRAEVADWPALSSLGENVTVIVLADPSPTPPVECDGTIFALPPEPAERAAGRAARFIADSYYTARRLEQAERRLEETEGELDKAGRLSESLKEHCEFYEMQRNSLAETVRRTAYLGQLSKEINCLDIEKIVEICVTKMAKMVDATRVSVYFYDEADQELVLKRANHPYPLTERVRLDEKPQSLMALAVKRKATLLIRDIDSFQASLPEPIDRTYADKYRSDSCIVVPLMSGGQVLAVLNLADKSDADNFDEVRDLPLIDHISQFIGIALRNCQLYQEVRLQAKTDGLTGFINHNAFFEELHREVERTRRTRANLSLILLDVDNFKLFNDVHGHQVGDRILQEVADTIRNSVRAIDIPARYGGDEFAVVLSDTDLNRAELVAERIRRAIASNPMTLGGRAFAITISAGVTQHKPGQAPSDMVSEVDAALYAAKSRGRNAVVTQAG